MNEYIRNALLVLNTEYPGYSFEMEEFPGCVLLYCRHKVSDKIFMKYTRFMNSDLSYEKIVKEGKRLMNENNLYELRDVVGWSDKNLVRNKYYIVPKEIIFQDEKTTIINWTDGTKTIVKCSDDDVFSPETGIALCYMKKFFTDNDSERFHRILKSLISVSKFKKSKQEDKSSGLATLIKEAVNIIYALEDNHDIDTRTPDNSGDNDPDGSAVEVE